MMETFVIWGPLLAVSLFLVYVGLTAIFERYNDEEISKLLERLDRHAVDIRRIREQETQKTMRTTWPGTEEDKALNSMFESGRKAGLEEAARIADRESADADNWLANASYYNDPPNSPRPEHYLVRRNTAAHIATSIRAKVEKS